MKSTAAAIWEPGGKWEVDEIEVDPPRSGEVLVRWVASGLCHSDEHIRQRDTVPRFPIVGGHEGAGVVEEIGPDVHDLAPGDHVVCSFLPACRECRFCRMGKSNLCDSGQYALEGCQLDGTFRFHGRGQDLGGMCTLGTFSQFATVSRQSLVKVADDIPLDVLSVIGCAVPTGWGSAVHAGGVTEGDVTVVYGVGGIGMNALQGARYAGAAQVVAVDPVAFKREQAGGFGATATASDAAEAHALVMDLTNGVGADQAVVSVGVLTADVVTAAVEAIRKGGTVVLTGLAAADDLTIQLPGTHVTLFEKRIQGAIFGSGNPGTDIPALVQLYREGRLKLDELITARYRVDQINEAYDDLAAGRNIRGVVIHDR